MVLVGRKAPDFTAGAVLGNGEIVDNFNLFEHIKGKKAVVFFYPLDFTFVCPSEIIAFDKRLADFQEKGCEVIGVSIDSVFSHNAWRNTAVNKGGIGEVKYTLVADTTHEVVNAYDVVDPNGPGIALRGSFLIDEEGIVRHQVINDGPLGRNIDEMLRMVDALAFHQEHGEVCPAQWEKGKSGMKASPDGVASYLTEHTSDLDKK
ncbi:peroxiredoxin [Vibrio porteresiae]|uniref:Thioredoxin peroxidase n=1 Tax=Vibrio porteresiae DSM 19223 TaxID=1123496 RepID=A0ABZ0QAX4_9VIBR|nr:peroxiredoxin C [Vibrio porteresiae]WPC73555.1 peroxiredoxin C [Vibrio porteresiae DSM 19223]